MSTMPKPFVFVLMPFDSAFDDIYKFGIKGACDDVGAYAERVDEQIFSEGILDRIFNQISKADVIIADMTGRNPNVFYEVGYAHALGKIVILLTQSAQDIPFDLKHRQHTVYGGKIDTLRTDLIPKLQWAIAQSKSIGRLLSAENFYLQLSGVEIPNVLSGCEMPMVSNTVQGNSFELPIHLRNDSLHTLPSISHAYLFTAEKSPIVPCQRYTFSARTSKPLASFISSPGDAMDGLTKQFRLQLKFNSLPPGGFEVSGIHFMFQGGATKAEAAFRLRLHSPANHHEYAFKMKVRLEAQKKVSRKPTRKLR